MAKLGAVAVFLLAFAYSAAVSGRLSASALGRALTPPVADESAPGPRRLHDLALLKNLDGSGGLQGRLSYRAHHLAPVLKRARTTSERDSVVPRERLSKSLGSRLPGPEGLAPPIGGAGIRCCSTSPRPSSSPTFFARSWCGRRSHSVYFRGQRQRTLVCLGRGLQSARRSASGEGPRRLGVRPPLGRLVQAASTLWRWCPPKGHSHLPLARGPGPDAGGDRAPAR